MDSKPKRQLTEQQRANLASGREKLKTLRADPDYIKGQKEKRESRKAERAQAEPTAAADAAAAAAAPVRSRSRTRVAPASSSTSSSSARGSEYAASVPTL